MIRRNEETTLTYQFLRGETYARTGAHRKNSSAKKSCIDDIRAELMREPQACSHVASPRPPTIVFGDHPDHVIAAIKAKAAQAVDRAGHRLRCDSPILFAGVASWPVPQAVIEKDPAEAARYRAWRNDTVAWLHARWGAALRTVVEHTDEKYPHVHFWVVPDFTAGRRLLISSVHPGYGAASAAAEAGAKRKQQQNAYKQAMKVWQDEYNREVGVKHGLARIGPRRQRLTRAEWLMQQQQAAALAVSHANVRQYATSLKEAADRHVAECVAAASQAAAREIAAATVSADGKLARLRDKAKRHVLTLGGIVQEHQTVIAEQATKIEEMEALLAQHGIEKGPSAV
jgi:hypothetical protein